MAKHALAALSPMAQRWAEQEKGGVIVWSPQHQEQINATSNGAGDQPMLDCWFEIRAANAKDALQRATDVCLEDTVELSSSNPLVAESAFLRHKVMGRVAAVHLKTQQPQRGGGGDGAASQPTEESNVYQARILFPWATTANELPQVLNVLFGNISIKPGLSLRSFNVPHGLPAFKGPRFGVQGLRQIVQVWDRPLLTTALKPMGSNSKQLAALAKAFALGGIDLIKDDHGIGNQEWSTFEERVRLCAAAVKEANSTTGRNSIYVANITGDVTQVVTRARLAKQLGAGGLLICPGLVGLDLMRQISADDSIALPILSHPSFLGTYTVSGAQGTGISHRAMYGNLMRLAGADAAIYPNFGGRFAYSKEECMDIVLGCAEEMGGNFNASLPMPGGGITMELLPTLFSVYGKDVSYLVGGALMRRREHLDSKGSPGGDITANTAEFLQMVKQGTAQYDDDNKRAEESNAVGSALECGLISTMERREIQDMALGIRMRVLQHTVKNNGGYLSQACSVAEVFSVLYKKVLRLAELATPLMPQPFAGVPGATAESRTGAVFHGPKTPSHDRFFMTPSQYSLVLYAALVECQRMDPRGMLQFNQDGSSVEMIGAEHSPGLEIMSGSLGQGISQAAGVALARKLQGDTGRVVVLMSDGELQVGMTWECLQAAYFHKLGNMLVLVDVNGFQCDGKMDTVMDIEPIAPRLAAFGCVVHVIDGHDIDALVRACSSLHPSRPTVVLCYTCPWNGMDFLKARAPKFHYVRFKSQEERSTYAAHFKALQKQNRWTDGTTQQEEDLVVYATPTATPVSVEAKTTAGTGAVSIHKQVHRANIVKFAAARKDLVLLSADLTSSVEADLFRDTYPDRFFSMGVAEQNMLSMAGGMAREGFRPFIHTFAVFIYRRALDQLMMSIAYPNLPVVFCGFLPGITTPGGATHQATEDIAIMRAVPNMTVLETGDVTEVESVLDVAYAIRGPVYIRVLRGEIPRLFPAEDKFQLNHARVLQAGGGGGGAGKAEEPTSFDVLVLSSGICTEEALRACRAITAHSSQHPVSIRHLHISTLKPFTDALVINSIKQAKRGVITFENHSVIGGLGGAVAELMAEDVTLQGRPLVRLGLNDTFSHGASRHYLMSEHGLDAIALIAAVERVCGGVSFGIKASDLEAVRLEQVHSLAKAEAL